MLYNPLKVAHGIWDILFKMPIKQLADFEISNEFEYLKGKSKESFKRIVNRKAEIYELLWLTKNQASHSKMENLNYSELKMQDYLKLPEI